MYLFAYLLTYLISASISLNYLPSYLIIMNLFNYFKIMLSGIKGSSVVWNIRMFIFLQSLFYIVYHIFKLVNNISECTINIRKKLNLKY